MIVRLTHELKIKLLEAIQSGTLDLSIFNNCEKEFKSDEEIFRELQRLERFEYDDEEFRERAEIIRRCADGEITRTQYDEEMVAFRLKLESEEYKEWKSDRGLKRLKVHSDAYKQKYYPNNLKNGTDTN